MKYYRLGKGIGSYKINVTNACAKRLGLYKSDDIITYYKPWDNPQILEAEIGMKEREEDGQYAWDGVLHDVIAWWGTINQSLGISIVLSERLYKTMSAFKLCPHFAYPLLLTEQGKQYNYILFVPDLNYHYLKLVDYSKTIFYFSDMMTSKISKERIMLNSYEEYSLKNNALVVNEMKMLKIDSIASKGYHLKEVYDFMLIDLNYYLSSTIYEALQGKNFRTMSLDLGPNIRKSNGTEI